MNDFPTFRLKRTKIAVEKALLRVESTKREKSKAIGDRLLAERTRFEVKAEKLRVLEAARIKEMQEILNSKFKIADLLRKMLRLRAENERKKKVWDEFLFLYFELITSIIPCRNMKSERRGFCNAKKRKLPPVILSNATPASKPRILQNESKNMAKWFVTWRIV